MSSRATGFLLFSALAVSPLAASAAEDAVHPVIRPLSHSKVYSQKVEKYGEMKVTYGSGKTRVAKTVSGASWWLRYHSVDDAGKRDVSVSAIEIIRNYESEVKRLGGTVHDQSAKSLLFSLGVAEGSRTWCSLKASPGFYILEIIDEKPLAKSLTFGADEMRAALDAEGRVAVYGIQFDTDKATLKPESQPTLDEVVKLLQALATLRLEVQGHTDSTGDPTHNRELSEQRAGAVTAALVKAGIAPARLVAKGYGADKPVGANDTEEGRAKNRRVELQKLDK